ncbi:MAG: hypothetical protein HKP48_07860 [Winogradskyella sp.]|uniref:hypothetical protein n=1 Tax=Winogradskyella sp. TaxID=1883156 RepID=UPI00181AE719|nr:hypothetical protein [Winogradskyella sp.]MBT8245737.1 hypothetical protein [Winogradskyella sp.]NNK23196.1 hypothetical protein [Winogradskyella sp.]
MAFDELKQNLKEADKDIHSYVKNSESYIYLKSFKMAMLFVTAVAQTVLVGALVLLALFILAMAASFGLGVLLNNTFYGFLIVGGCIVLATLIVYALRRQINKPIIRKFSENFFDKS